MLVQHIYTTNAGIYLLSADGTNSTTMLIVLYR